jgi:hypothetical protein
VTISRGGVGGNEEHAFNAWQQQVSTHTHTQTHSHTLWQGPHAHTYTVVISGIGGAGRACRRHCTEAR